MGVPCTLVCIQLHLFRKQEIINDCTVFKTNNSKLPPAVPFMFVNNTSALIYNSGLCINCTLNPSNTQYRLDSKHLSVSFHRKVNLFVQNCIYVVVIFLT